MKLRPYNPDRDFEIIKHWISDERTHAMWCANRTEFPLERNSFDELLEDVSSRCGDSPYVAVNESDKPVGFFCYSLNRDTNEGMLKFVMVDPDKRGIGIGKELIRRAVQYAFDVTKAGAVQLMVFTENNRAKKCYESVGFRERHTDPDAFHYLNESWGRCNMVIENKQCTDQSDNPWKEISLDDYENHMSLDSVKQLQTMNAMMKDQFESYPVETAMILGVAGGNGLEHIDPAKYKRVYGVDINEEYLSAVSERYAGLSDILECLCVDLVSDFDRLPQAQLVIANLLIEYIGYPAFQRAISVTEPKYVSCIIQINTDEGKWVSDSPYLHAFDGLDAIHHQMEEDALSAAMNEIGYQRIFLETRELPNGKALVRVDFQINPSLSG